jgi:hypothetical protein
MRLDEEARVTLVNFQGLTPLKNLDREVEALFSVLRGGVLIGRMVQILKGNVPAILSSRVSQKEQHDFCLGRDAGVVGIEDEVLVTPSMKI